MSRTQRDAAVRCFMAKDRATVMLMSSKCGGVGLNLTRANRQYPALTYLNDELNHPIRCHFAWPRLEWSHWKSSFWPCPSSRSGSSGLRQPSRHSEHSRGSYPCFATEEEELSRWMSRGREWKEDWEDECQGIGKLWVWLFLFQGLFVECTVSCSVWPRP